MSDLKARVAALVKASRTGKGITQEELAGRVDLSVQSISAIENGKNLPALDTVLDLVEVLGFEISDLSHGKPQPEHRVNLEMKARALIRRLDDGSLLLAIRQLEALVDYADRPDRQSRRGKARSGGVQSD